MATLFVRFHSRKIMDAMEDAREMALGYHLDPETYIHWSDCLDGAFDAWHEVIGISGGSYIVNVNDEDPIYAPAWLVAVVKEVKDE